RAHGGAAERAPRHGRPRRARHAGDRRHADGRSGDGGRGVPRPVAERPEHAACLGRLGGLRRGALPAGGGRRPAARRYAREDRRARARNGRRRRRFGVAHVPLAGAVAAPGSTVMTYAHAERLSALDASFLSLEDSSCHMHIGAVAVFEAAPLRTPEGGIDIDRIRTLMEAGIPRLTRYRQKLAWVPLLDHPVWVDDARFNIAYHVRHTHLPRPGDARQLKRLAGRLMSQELDRGKPLWEMWVVEGLEGDRFAIVTKVHHCMIDGVGSVELTGSVMRPTPDPDPRLAEPPPRWMPRPAPGPRELWLREAWHRATAPLALGGLLREALSAPRAAIAQASTTAAGLAD